LPKGLLLNILLLTVVRIDNIFEKDFFADLVRKFRDEGHSVYIVTPREPRFGKKTELIERDDVKILSVKALNIQMTNVIKYLFLDGRFAIPHYLSRLLSNLVTKMPIIMAADSNTDVGSMAEKNVYGHYWCESNCVGSFVSARTRSFYKTCLKGRNWIHFFYTQTIK
jgi:hypothetical protein